jgi:outer membrane protein OmpA-like peptidoglycan-associated protein
LVATNEGYLKYTAKVKTINDLGSPAIEKDIEMANEFISVGDELLVNIDIIYFDFDKYDIRPDAALELDKVIEVMNKYPELKIHATSHTDARGSKRYNKSLSNKRAKSSVEYIISKGIDVSRITGEGKGEEELVNECIDGVECTEEQHQLNRRTKFRVVEEIKVKQEQ